MAPQGQAYHTDWVWSNNSNVHATNNRDWFVTYTAFESWTTDLYTMRNQTQTLGIGDVELDVKTSLTSTGPTSHRKIILRDVLFTPDSVCNIIGNPILKEYNVAGSWNALELKDQNGRTAGFFDDHHLSKLLLVGQQKGRSSLDPNALYAINAIWPDNERLKWKQHIEEQDANPSLNVSHEQHLAEPDADEDENEADAPPYTAAEKAWLKKHYRGEFHFLMSYELSIYDEDEREEGRRIARALMEADIDGL